ncbi:hypothetical protein [Mycoplasmopsis agalactiae]|nr:hypothetical protein [Mycoplasmopsis agalactiae]
MAKHTGTHRFSNQSPKQNDEVLDADEGGVPLWNTEGLQKK